MPLHHGQSMNICRNISHLCFLLSFFPMLYLFTFMIIDRKCNPEPFTSFLTYILLHSSVSTVLQQNPAYVVYCSLSQRISLAGTYHVATVPEKAWVDVQRTYLYLEHLRAAGQVKNSLDQIYWKALPYIDYFFQVLVIFFSRVIVRQ